MPRKYPCDLVLTDFIPACTGFDIVNVHESWVQISNEGKAFIENQCNTVVAVTGSVDDLSAEPKASEKLAAVFQFQGQVIVLFDFNIAERFCFEVFSEWIDKIQLAFGQDQLYSLIF